MSATAISSSREILIALFFFKIENKVSFFIVAAERINSDDETRSQILKSETRFYERIRLGRLSEVFEIISEVKF